MSSNNPHIFYTDDDVDDREIFRDALAEADGAMILTTTGDGEALLNMLNEPPPVPRVIFLDLNMPGLNGFEALRRIRSEDRLQDCPVVIFTTTDDEKAVRTTRSLGADLFVPKPQSFSGLKRVIAACVGRDWAQRADDSSYVMRIK